MKDIIYQKNYEFEDNYWWFAGRRKIVLDIIKQICQGTRDKRILDVGCGTGINLRYLSGYGKVVGLDISSEALKFCRERGKLPLVKADAYMLPFLKNSLDLICALDVLEHMESDEIMIKELYRVCSRGGAVLLFVPAHKFLWRGEDIVSHHKRRYSYAELKNKVVRRGFKIKTISYANMFLFPIMTAVIMFNKLFRPKTLMESDLNEINPIFNRLLSCIFSFESFFLRRNCRLPFGTSLICLAEKE